MFEKYVFENLVPRYFSKDMYSQPATFLWSSSPLAWKPCQHPTLTWFSKTFVLWSVHHQTWWRSNSQCYEGNILQSKRKSILVLVFQLMNFLNPFTIDMFVRCGILRINDIFRAIFLYMIWCLKWWLSRNISFYKEKPLTNKTDYIRNYRIPHSRSHIVIVTNNWEKYR